MAFFNFSIFCATLLFISITFALPIAQPPQSQLGDIFGITSSPSPSTCAPILLSWSGGAAPFTIQIKEGGNTKQTLPSTSARNASFNISGAADITVVVADSNGRQTTSDLIRVSSNCASISNQPSPSSTADFSNSSFTPSTHAVTVSPGMIAGLAIGGLVLTGIIIASVWFFCRLQRRAAKIAAAEEAANERDAEWSSSRPRPEVSSDDSSSVTLARTVTPPTKELGGLKVTIPTRTDPGTLVAHGYYEVGEKDQSMSCDTTSSLGRSKGNAWRATDSIDSPPSAGRTRSSMVLDSTLSKASQGPTDRR